MKKLIAAAFAALFAVMPLSAEIKVLAFSGSTRKDSYNQQLVKDAAEMARQMGATVTVVSLKDYPMPFYDADLEAKEKMPKNAKKLRNLMMQSDAIIIASPEYNGSLPAVLKNTLDWASRSEEGGSSLDPFKGKRFAIMSASPGKGGGARALVHLRSILEGVGGVVVSKQVSIPQAHEYFVQKERPENAQLKQEIAELLQIKARSTKK